MMDGMVAAARERMSRPGSPPTLEQTLAAARQHMILAVTTGHFETGDAAFTHGTDRTYWLDGWPVGEWVDGNEMFPGSGRTEIVALRLFDPNMRESLHWFLNTSDCLLFDAEHPPRRKRVSIPTERREVEEPIADYLDGKGHSVRRQVTCPSGRLDIIDDTLKLVVECKAAGGGGDLVAAVNQLRRYAPYFPSYSLAAAVPAVDSDVEWLAQLIRASGILVIEVDLGIDI